MNQTDQTLLEQLRITELEVEYRKSLFAFSEQDAQLLAKSKFAIENNLDSIITEFYRMQTSNPEIALLIGDADTLERLRRVQRQYILDLFSGFYDLEYVNNRLRIGLIHKRIGVEPKLYFSAIHTLKDLLFAAITCEVPDEMICANTKSALDKLLSFDVTLVVETYIRSLVSEIETAKDKTEQYARTMELKVKERTRQLEELSRTDPLTGLLNVRHLQEIFTSAIRSAQRRSEAITVVYIDVDDFKKYNDTFGHQYGDEILQIIGHAIRDSARAEDSCIRYGGDEFCVLLTKCTADQAKDVFLNRLLHKISEKSEVKISIGIAQTGPQQFVDPSTLIHMADQLMYSTKNGKKVQDPPHQPE